MCLLPLTVDLRMPLKSSSSRKRKKVEIIAKEGDEAEEEEALKMQIKEEMRGERAEEMYSNHFKLSRSSSSSSSQSPTKRKNFVDNLLVSEFKSSTKVESLVSSLKEVLKGPKSVQRTAAGKEYQTKAIVFSQYTNMLDLVEVHTSISIERDRQIGKKIDIDLFRYRNGLHN